MIDEILGGLGLDGEGTQYDNFGENANSIEEETFSTEINDLSSSVFQSDGIDQIDLSALNGFSETSFASTSLTSHNITDSIFSLHETASNIHVNNDPDIALESSVHTDMIEPSTNLTEVENSGILEPHVDYLKIGNDELSKLNEKAHGIERSESHASEISFGGKLDPHVCQQLHGCSGHAECDKCYGSTITSL